MGLFDKHKHRKENKEVVIIEETEFIIVDGRHYHEHDEDEEKLELEIIKKLSEIINKLITPSQEEKVRLILTTKFNNNNSILQIMAIQLNVGQFSLDTLSLIDSDSGNAVAATFANNQFNSSDPNVFTSTVDPSNPNQTRDQAVAAGSASLNVSSDVSYTDANTGNPVTKTLTLSVPVSVAAVTAGENVALVMTQGTPTAV
jgi:hypothetical protein